MFSSKHKIHFFEIYGTMPTLMDYFNSSLSIEFSKFIKDHIVFMLAFLTNFF